MKVTQEQFIDIVRDSQADKISVCYQSDVKMNKKENPFFHKEGRTLVPDHSVVKISTQNYIFGKGYAEAVNEAKTSDDEFKSRDSYLDAVIPSKIYRKKDGDQLYLRVMINPDVEIQPFKYYVDGNPATEEDMKVIDQFEQRYEHKVHTQESVGVENPVMVINFKLENIIAVKLDGVIYEIEG